MRISTSFLALSFAAAAISVAPQVASAQSLPSGVYAGVFAGSQSFESTLDFAVPGGAQYTGSTSNFGVLAGWRTSGNPLYYGVEIDASIPADTDVIFGCDGGGIGTWCGQDYNVHVRGIVGYQLNSVNVFGGLGFAVSGMEYHDGGGSPVKTTITGYSIGLGVEYQLSNGITLRLEDIYDDYSETDFGGSYSGTWAQNTVRVAAIFTF